MLKPKRHDPKMFNSANLDVKKLQVLSISHQKLWKALNMLCVSLCEHAMLM